MSLPAAFSSLALLVTASVGEGLMLLTRSESISSLIKYPLILEWDWKISCRLYNDLAVVSTRYIDVFIKYLAVASSCCQEE